MRRLAVVILVIVALVACEGDGGQETSGNGEAAAQDGGLSFAVVVHDEPAGTFWGVVKNGAEQAAEELGGSVTVQGSGEPQEQADQVEAAIAQGVDGIAVSLANPDAMRGPLQSAAEEGIPVVTLNSGLSDWQNLGAITHVGQDEIIAGRGAGERLNEAGVTKVLCAIHEVGNVALDERCRGVEDTFEGEVVREQIDINDPVASQSTINSALEADPDIDGVMTLNPDMATTAALPAIQDVGRDISLATFDLGTDVIEGIIDGDVLFAIDQQQYMQGYLPIVFLALNIENLNTPGGGQPVLTGPGYVTKDNAEQVLELTEQGTR
ncbi:MAG: sugar ABC transporter substrate-binding protein [Actinobacteria bacterium]|nr:sugar ABC transporter substrate-binding protein [Actinomycetota bacterium]MDQ3532025.1 sugar ABC transporter substrate-binding protein [Actinomycetota bacterium]